jgi:DNA-3-methyladenine glycosylase
MKILPRDFYLRDDVVLIARELLGKMLYSQFDGLLTGGIIVETEAYAGVIDKASHAYGNRRTQRTEVMYSMGGTAYVYLCYGVHSLFNVVTNKENVPHAILIRAIKPVIGIETMLKRSGKDGIDKAFGTGPGKVSKLLGIHYSQSGIDLTKKPVEKQGQGIWLADEGNVVLPETIVTGQRIGVGYAGQDALLPYRFRIFV